MVALRVAGFAGVVPRTHRRLLADNQAQVATNTRLTSGQIDALRSPFLVHNPAVSGLISIFRMVSGATEKWLTWAKDVDVARGPVAGDTLQRIYWTGDNEPRMSTFAAATGGSGPYPTATGATQHVLGVFGPTTAASLVVTGGSGNTTTRSYVYTFLTQLGEESMPSPPVTVTGFINGSWDLSAMEAFPANTFTVTGGSWSGGVATLTVASTIGLRVGEAITVTGVTPSGYNATDVPITALTSTQVSYALASNPGAWSSGGTIARVAVHNTTSMVRRIYRTVTNTAGDDELRFVADVSGTTYSDTLAETVVARATRLPSTDWAQPPVDARGVIATANGIMVAFAKNEVLFSEPFQPHAWPSKYRQTVKHQIVGLGSYGTTAVIATDGVPYTITGVEPATMGGGAQAIEEAWPCVSKRGIVSASFGVMFPTPQGLALIGVGGPILATREFYTAEEWRNVKPETFKAAVRDAKFYAAYDFDANFSFVLIIDKSEFASVSIANFKAAELWTDPLSGKVYAVVQDKIYEWDGPQGEKSLYDWMSKEFLLPAPVNLGAAKVDADFTSTPAEIAAAVAAYAAVLSANQAMINAGYIGGGMGTLPIGFVEIGGSLMTLPPPLTHDALTFELYVDNILKFARSLTSSRAFRLPAGYKGDNCAVRVAGNVKVSGVVVAETMDGLKAA